MNNVVRPARQQLGRTSIHQRQASLISAAVSLFAAIGFRGTTTKPITLAAGVSETLLFKHFPTKHALYSVLLSEKTHYSVDYRNRWKRPQRNEKISDSSCCLPTIESEREQTQYCFVYSCPVR
ncbi:TetR/AcrR family transcriptional regulator [Nitrospira sp. BLG_1]|uniref:TetR/AcrR family transcriptional regulator n=1 Tax=Nitrospira sp. BLG_1 TaxID=3395883 RepID=UPI0039BC8AEC